MPRRRAVLGIVIAVLVAALVGVAVARNATSTKSTNPNSSPSSQPPSGSTPAPGAGAPSAPSGAPRGIYVALRSTIPPQVLSSTAVAGVYLHFGWSDLEPTQGGFDFGVLDQAIDKARQAGKSVMIGVSAGALTPQWVMTAGARFVRVTQSAHQGKSTGCSTNDYPAPWDGAFVTAWSDFIRGLGSNLHESAARYAAVTQLKLTGINDLTDESRLPAETPQASSSTCNVSDAVSAWKALGYKPSLVEGAFRTFATTWAQTFPDKQISLEIIPNNGFPAIGENGADDASSGAATTVALVKAGRSAIRNFAVQQNNLGPRGNFRVVTSVPVRGFQLQGVQFGQLACVPGNRDPASAANPLKSATVACDPGAFQAALEHGIQLGASWIEVFSADVSAYESVIETTKSSFAQP